MLPRSDNRRNKLLQQYTEATSVRIKPADRVNASDTQAVVAVPSYACIHANDFLANMEIAHAGIPMTVKRAVKLATTIATRDDGQIVIAVFDDEECVAILRCSEEAAHALIKAVSSALSMGSS